MGEPGSPGEPGENGTQYFRAGYAPASRRRTKYLLQLGDRDELWRVREALSIGFLIDSDGGLHSLLGHHWIHLGLNALRVNEGGLAALSYRVSIHGFR